MKDIGDPKGKMDRNRCKAAAEAHDKAMGSIDARGATLAAD